MMSCGAQFQEDVTRYMVMYWVLLLPVWLGGLLLMLVLLGVALCYRRWPVVAGGCILGGAAALTTYGLWVAATSTWSLAARRLGAGELAAGYMNRLL